MLKVFSTIQPTGAAGKPGYFRDMLRWTLYCTMFIFQRGTGKSGYYWVMLRSIIYTVCVSLCTDLRSSSGARRAARTRRPRRTPSPCWSRGPAPRNWRQTTTEYNGESYAGASNISIKLKKHWNAENKKLNTGRKEYNTKQRVTFKIQNLSQRQKGTSFHVPWTLQFS